MLVITLIFFMGRFQAASMATMPFSRMKLLRGTITIELARPRT